MKKNEEKFKIIWISILTIIVIALLGYIIYREYTLMNDKNSSNDKVMNDVQTTVVVEKQDISLNEKLERYLKTVPLTNFIDEEDANYFDNDAYFSEKITIDNIDKRVIGAMVFEVCETVGVDEEVPHSACGGDGKCAVDTYVTIEEFNKKLKSMYNLNSFDVKGFKIPGASVEKSEKYYAAWYGSGYYGLDKIGKVIRYEITDNELIIYENVGFVEYFPGEANIYKTTNINSLVKVFDTDEEDVIKKYINDNLKDFNTFKHVFNKDENGNYFWYSTELVK